MPTVRYAPIPSTPDLATMSREFDSAEDSAAKKDYAEMFKRAKAQSRYARTPQQSTPPIKLKG